MKRLIVDLDGTLTVLSPNGYEQAVPNRDVIVRLQMYRAQGYAVVINTSRNVATYDGNVGKINVHTLPVILDWLRRHDVPCDEVHVGKPWCGEEGFYIDDKAIRPSEFVKYSLAEIRELLAHETGGG